MPKTRTYSSWRAEKLSDPERAARYLSAALNDSTEAFLQALGNVIQAHRVSTIAKKAGVTRESLYRSFSTTGNPAFETLKSVLKAMGLKFPEVVAQAKTSSANPVPEAGRPTGFRKSRRRRGVVGYSQRQLSLPFTASPTAVAELSPSNTGVYMNLAEQRQVAGAVVLRDEFVPDINPQSASLPGFLSYYAMQNESAAASLVP